MLRTDLPTSLGCTYHGEAFSTYQPTHHRLFGLEPSLPAGRLGGLYEASRAVRQKTLQLFKGHGRVANFVQDPNRDERHHDSAVSCQLMVGLPVPPVLLAFRLCQGPPTTSGTAHQRVHKGRKKKGKKARESDHGPWSVGHAILLSAIALPPFSRPHRSSAARLIPMAEYLVSLSEVKAAGDG
jgi:hypothetical protein